jgi:hypothetical protein
MTVLLGPCLCQGCEALVWWARHAGWPACWRGRDGREHYC